MVVALVVMTILFALTPAFGIVGSNAATGLVCAATGLGIVGTAFTLQPGAVRKLNVLLRPALLGVLLAPFGWMLLQLAPMPLHWLSDPVWASTSAALNLPMTGSVTIDIGATLLSIVRYSGLLATALIVAASTSDRQSAEKMLYVLTGIAAFVAGIQIIREMGNHGGASDASGAEAIAAIGMTLACSAVIHILEQLRTKRGRVAFPTRLTIGVSAATAALFLCTASITLSGDTTVFLAGSLGAGVAISIFVIRTLSLGSWGKAGVGAAFFLMLLLGLLAVTPMKTDVDPTVALPSKSEISSDLMLSDVPLLGRGAGSVEDLLPVYHQLKGGLSGANATAAAVITVEMGRMFLWMFIAALAAGVVILVRGSLIRNRDYVYAAAGAGILVAFSLVMFVSTDVLSLAASLLASASLGLAWAQARSAKENRFSAGQSAAAIEVSSLHQGPFYLDRPGLRLAFVLFGLALSAEAGWVVIPELFASGAEPDGATHSVVTLRESENLENAASIALVRGDLWARSAIASAMFLDKNASLSIAYDHVRDILTRALRFAPYQGHAWLTLALLADQYERSRYDLTALLKMVYYTAANDINLVPARTKLALRLNATALDVELQDMIRRDLTLILRQLPNLRPALLDAYRAANPGGRALAERMIAGIDPGFLKTAQGR